MAGGENNESQNAMETEPLLGDVPREVASANESILTPDTKKRLTAGRVFVKISFLLLGTIHSLLVI